MNLIHAITDPCVENSSILMTVVPQAKLVGISGSLQQVSPNILQLADFYDSAIAPTLSCSLNLLA